MFFDKGLKSSRNICLSKPFLEVGGALADRLVHGVDPQLVIDSLTLKLVRRMGKGLFYPDPFQNE